MKRIYSIIIILCCITYCNAQDTIELNIPGYQCAVDSVCDSMNVTWGGFSQLIVGNKIDLPIGGRIYGMSVSVAYSWGDSVNNSMFFGHDDFSGTIILLKYIDTVSLTEHEFVLGPSSSFDNPYWVLDPLDHVFEIVDSIPISSNCPPSKYMTIPHGKNDIVIPLYEGTFNRPVEIDSSIYFIAWEKKYQQNSCATVRMIDTPADSNYIIWIEPTLNNFGLITSEYYTRALFFKNIHCYAIFAITDSTLLPEPDRPCLPRVCPRARNLAVDVVRRNATITWSGDSLHCGYELMFGDITAPISSYTVVGTTDTSFVYNSMMPEVNYVCSVRALRCFDNGDSVWSSWSDTVQFHRPMFRLKGMSNNVHWGYVNGGGLYDPGEEVLIRAIPRNDNYRFTYWHTGDTTDTLSFTIVCDTVFTAFFEQIGSDDDTVGIASARDGIVLLMPNPANNTVYVKAPEQMQLIQIIDMTGNTVLQFPISTETAVLDLHHLPAGIYMIRLYLPGRTEVRKLVIKH